MSLAEVSPDYDPHLEARRDLAAALRWAVRYNLHEGVANHFSFAVNDDGTQFLLNPRNRHWSRVRASDLVLLDANDLDGDQTSKVDITAWCIHGAVHRQVPRARCVLHVHSKYATALACLKDPRLPPIDQNTMRFYNRFAFDPGFDGMGLGEEAERLPSMLADKDVLLMGNHGVMVCGETVGGAFDALYYFERACETFFTAKSSGRELLEVSHEVAEKTARQWENYDELDCAHLAELRAILDEEGSNYAD